MRQHRATLGITLVAAAALAVPAPAGAITRLRLDGIGPLELGMSRAAAVKTGWLTRRSRGCPLASPVPITYRVAGHKAPRGVVGTAEFARGRLTNLSFTRGVRTAAGVTVRKTTTARMASRYRKLGYTAQAVFVPTFQQTFVTVTRKDGTPVIAGAGPRKTVTLLAIPGLSLCE